MTEQLSLLPPTPVQTRRMPLEPIMRSAEIDDGYRWTLRRAWGAGACILWCGLNPSTADAKKDDPTMLREIGFSYRWGFGSLVKVNIYPFIASTTDRLKAWKKTWDHKAYEDHGMRPWDLDKSSWSAFHHNLGIIEGLIENDTVCVAAWGNGVDPADLTQLFEGVHRHIWDDEHGDVGLHVEWKCLGTNENGSPKHTLARGAHRIPDDADLKIWKKGGS